MLALKYFLMVGGFAMIAAAVGILTYDLHRERLHRRALETPGGAAPVRVVVRWRTSLALAMLAWGPLLLAFSIVIVPSGMAAVRVNEVSGTLPGTLYPGAHLVVPLVEDVALFDIRDQIFTTGVLEDGKAAAKSASTKAQFLDVQAKEGLTLGLAITVRYRLDAKRLDYIQANLPHPVEREIVPPVVASVWREIVPNYTVRDVFSAKRDEVRQRAAALITQRLAADGIVVKEVMLRDIQLPLEYAKGLEQLLLKEQENDRMGVETELKAKQVKIAEYEAEAAKVQQIKAAEGEAQAKVIDSKAESERRKVLAEAEADRIRVTAAADAQRLQSEAAILKDNPLLINKIVAERLSDKLQIMMVPADGKYFFANDVLRSMSMPNQSSQSEQR